MKPKFTPGDDDIAQYLDLTPNNVYRVIAIEGDHFRLMSHEGLPYCYPKFLFTMMDDKWPDDWIIKIDNVDEQYVYPKSLAEKGFFERYFDGNPDAILLLRKRLQMWHKGQD